jgi:cardiolipin synthase (CMP-forming)
LQKLSYWSWREGAILTTANLITLIRIIAIPFFLVAILYKDYRLAFFLFSFAGLTDSLDGFIARFFHQKTRLGAVMDPIADKLLLSTAYISLAIPREGESYIIPIWLTIFILSRDIIIIIFVVIQFLIFDSSLENFMPSFWGKLTTTFQISYAVAVLLKNSYGLPLQIVNLAMWLVVVFTAISGIHYLWRSRDIEVQGI